MPAKLVKVSGYNVRLPKGVRSLSPVQRTKISRLASDLASRRKRLATGEGCVIFFPRGADAAVQRCEGRKLRATNRRQCRNRKKKFIKCPRR